MDIIKTTLVNNHGYSMDQINDEIHDIIEIARERKTDTITQQIIDGDFKMCYNYEWKVFIHFNKDVHIFINKENHYKI